MKAGDTFFLAEQNVHLYMILSDPEKDPDRIVLVNFTTLTDEKENVCLIQVGDHPYIAKPSCVAYRHALVVTSRQLEAARTQNALHFHNDLSHGLLQRIRNASADSRHFPPACYEILLEQDLIEFDDLE